MVKSIEPPSDGGSGKEMTYNYDYGNLRLSNITRQDGMVMSYQYDTTDRMIKETRTKSGVAEVSSKSFHLNGLNKSKKTVQVIDYGVRKDITTSEYEYDNRGLILKQKQTIQFGDNNVSYSTKEFGMNYDIINRVTQMTYSGGRVLDFKYDSKFRMNVVETMGFEVGEGTVPLIHHDAFKGLRPSGTYYGNDFQLNTGYDRTYRVSGNLYNHFTSGEHLYFHQQLDNNGNRYLEIRMGGLR